MGKSSLENLGEMGVEGIDLADRERENREDFVRRCSQVMERSAEKGRTRGARLGLPTTDGIPFLDRGGSMCLPLPHAATALRTT